MILLYILIMTTTLNNLLYKSVHSESTFSLQELKYIQYSISS
jgi:hypothetical protein